MLGINLYLITRETKERVDYQIYDKYTCEPTDLDCLNQNQDGKKEVTLITCNPGGLTRLICKGKGSIMQISIKMYYKST